MGITKDVDYTGKKFGYWEVLERAPARTSPSGFKRKYWLCRCRCGTIKEVLESTVRDEKYMSCGCYAKIVNKQKTPERIQKKIQRKGYWKYQVGDKITNTSCTIQITEQVYNDGSYEQYKKKHGKYYMYDCLTCGYHSDYEHMIIESNFKLGRGCPICGNTHLVVKGINDIATTRPDISKYFTNIEDTYKYSFGTNQKVSMTCPHCSQSDMYVIGQTSQYGFSCRFCGDGISYPEKFVRNVIEQSGEEYIFQLTRTTFPWCQNYRYDIYLPKHNTIIEVHGAQHYAEEFVGGFNAPGFSNQAEADTFKRNLALNNGITTYIELDCRESNKDWIQNSIFNSLLKDIIDLSIINFDVCNKNSTHSLICDVSRYYMDNNKPTPPSLVKIFGIAHCTVVDYLKKGAKIGLCDYNPKETNIHYVVDVWKDEEYLGRFKHVGEFVKFAEETYGVHMRKESVYQTCKVGAKRYGKTVKGFTCKYVETK